MADYGDNWDGQSVTTNWDTARNSRPARIKPPGGGGRQGPPLAPVEPAQPPVGGGGKGASRVSG